MSAPATAENVGQALTATRPIIAARLTRVTEKKYRPGVLGLRAAPQWTGGEFTHGGVPVTVVPCPSTLAVWEAIEAHADGEWLVVLTPVDETNLGDGIRAHLIDGRLLSPDPWAALRGTFAATTIEPALYRVAHDRDLAMGLLAVLPASAIIPAPGGVLTRSHVLAAVAHAVLRITQDQETEIDQLAVLEWSVRPGADEALRQLRATGGAELTAATSVWLAQRAGRLGPVVERLATAGRLADLVPMGLVAGVLVDDGPGVEKARGRFEERLGHDVDTEALSHWYQSVSTVVTATLDPAGQERVLAAAERHVASLGAETLAETSQILPRGLRARIGAVATEISSALPASGIADADADAAVVPVAALASVERRWSEAGNHTFARSDRGYRVFEAAVQLVRWLAREVEPERSLTGLVDRHVRDDAWVDAAVTTVRRGVDDPAAAGALRRLIDVVGVRRRAHDRAFAAALADARKPTVPVVEELLGSVVIPLARERATLLLVVDALSMSVATDIVRDAVVDGWSEGAVLGASGRTGALAVLPTLTGRSRTSLLAGELREGTSDTERTAFLAAIKAAGLQAKAGAVDPIFHKKALDARPAGGSLATDVANAIADTDGRPLVSTVLNYVDDTLHHTDPGGTDWSIDVITHLRPLLEASRKAGRVVVLTSDHGHIIERGSAKRERSSLYGLRAHGDLERVGDGEVLVSGPRVLTAGGKAVLAVDEDIRYGNVNAGYHGGGSPAEAVVPVIALYTGDRPGVLGNVGPVEPAWWWDSSGGTGAGGSASGGSAASGVTSAVRKPTAKKQAGAVEAPSLFDEPAAESPAADAPGAEPVSLADQVLASPVFAGQWQSAGRMRVSKAQIGELLRALLSAPARELPTAQIGGQLGVAAHRVGGAVSQVKMVLDVEGYQVLEAGPGVVRVDEALLREQFGVV